MSDALKSGLWKKDGNSGSYYGGSIKVDKPGEYWINVYKNDRKTEEKHPDLNLQLKPKEPRTSGAADRAAQAVSAIESDEIPFN